MEDTTNPSNLDPKVAKAEAKAASAKAKALRPWYKKKRFIVPGGLVVLAALGSLAGGGEDGSQSSISNVSTGASNNESNNESNNDAGSTVEQTMPGIGDNVVSGNFTFTVNGMECGIASVGNSTLGQEAQGEYCKVNLTVENTGNEADYFAASSQTVQDDQGREFDADTSAMIYLEEGDDVWLGADINPGNSAEVVILYDMPVGVEPVLINLVDGMFSSGVDVSLR